MFSQHIGCIYFLKPLSQCGVWSTLLLWAGSLIMPPLQGAEHLAGSPSALLNKQMTVKMVANYIIIFQMSHFKAKGTLLLNLLLAYKMPKVKRTCSLVLASRLLKILQY